MSGKNHPNVQLCFQQTTCHQRNLCVSLVADEKLDSEICGQIDESCGDFFDYSKGQCLNSVSRKLARHIGKTMGTTGCANITSTFEVHWVDVLRKDVCLLAAAQEQQDESICDAIEQDTYKDNCRIYANLGDD